MASTSRVPGVTRIVVLRANALGDYLFCLPALHALRTAYPKAELVLLGAPWHVRSLSARPGPVDRFEVAPALPGIRHAEPDDPMPASDAERCFTRLREERFDIAIQAHGGGRNSNPVVAKLGARVTAGSRTRDALPLDRTVRYTYYQPEIFRHLEVVGLVGADPVTITPSFEVTDDDRAELVRVVGEPTAPRVALHPGASDARRRWPAERFAAVADELARHGAELVVTGTGAERDPVERVVAGARAPLRPLLDALTVGGLAALYASCRLVISNDTGPLHLAAAVGAPTVGLYWVGNLINSAGPYRDRHRAIESWTTHCPVCGADCAIDRYPDRGGRPPCRHRPSFVADIPVSEVVEESLDLYHGQAS